MNSYPLRHLSVRVPWHDSGWKGTICNEPHLNGSCAKLRGIAEGKNDEAELSIAGMRLDNLPRNQWPCCIDERATFMAPFEMHHEKRHALAERGLQYFSHFRPTLMRFPAYSAGIVPFYWMLRRNLEIFRETLELEVDISREPTFKYKIDWVNEFENQTSLLNGFAAHLQPENSVCLFYAKHVPFVEGTDRIIVGVGRIKHIGELLEHERNNEGPRGMIWERPVQHSIRPNERDGFLMPYLEVLRRASEAPGLDLEPYTAFAPSERWDEFSYGSQHITHDGAISALLSTLNALDRIEQDFGIATEKQRQWIHDELIRLWKVRGPFPGLGAVLHAFGLSRGLFVAHALQQHAGENADPWPWVDAAFRDPASVLEPELQRDIRELARTWNNLPSERRSSLRLLSRFELSVEQAKHLYSDDSRKRKKWDVTDAEMLQNPYRIFEASRHDLDVIHLLTIDRGVFPDDSIRKLHPLEEPMELESAVDPRRVRAFSVWFLEEAASCGHTLQTAGALVEAIRNSPAYPECRVTSDILDASVDAMGPEIEPIETDDSLALQLSRYLTIRNVVRKNVLGRIKGNRHVVNVDWAKLIAERFTAPAEGEEKRAQEEKAETLAELAESRFSILAGPAGTGKTSVLGILCNQGEISKDGLLLLAPTGKARVRLQVLSGLADIQAMTVAQFLNKNGRYDTASGRYHMSDNRPRARSFGTVIVDEASMLTEDMLGALLDALQGVKRLILVGDPAQLPPIGAGRPFVDIIAALRPDDIEMHFPRVANGYTELTIERRQIGAERPDRRLARWFSATPPAPGDDDIFSIGSHETTNLRFVEWEKPEDFQSKLLEILTEELKLSSPEDQSGFDSTLGAASYQGHSYFNPSNFAKHHESEGAVKHVENWQILSPLRGMPFGVNDINRQIHERFRSSFMELALRQRYRKIPKPLGAEKIVYGDKIINLNNHRRDGKKVYPQSGALGYLANGEIGIAVGHFRNKRRNWAPTSLEVEFSSQPSHTYKFNESDFRDEGEVALELAYALTVHKAQGSQFGLVILVLPEGHPILSRELVYTALTRHQDKVVVMHQGQRSLLKELTAPHHSETARRQTNLLTDCRMLEFPQSQDSVFLQEGLVHRTSKGLAVRSKSELLIAEALGTAGIDFEYEKPLTFHGQTRYPDFTIEDEIYGRTVYWEHLGMLSNPEYRAAWERKLAWYQNNGVNLAGDGDGGDTVLITTTDSMENGLDMIHVNRLISEVCGG